MARIRSIKPEWIEDERLASLSDTTRMVSVALITLADDYGNGRAHPMFLASRIWPYDEDFAEVPRKLAASLGELADIGFIQIYKVKNQSYFNIVNWDKHQRVTNAGKPLVPQPEYDSGESPDVDACSTDNLAGEFAASSPRDSASSRLDRETERDRDKEGECARDSAASGPTPDSDPDSHRPPPGQRPLPELIAALYREVSGNTDLSDMSPTWTARQREAVARFIAWSERDLAKLRAGLETMADDFMRRQPVHVWANSIGVGGSAKPRAMQAPGPDEYNADFRELLGDDPYMRDAAGGTL